jgi:Glyoxalase-like domain
MGAGSPRSSSTVTTLSPGGVLGGGLGCTHEEEVERLLRLGARHADVGQGKIPWVVLADPEGNEFCVLGPLATSSD